MMVKDYDTCTDEELIARLRAGEREITDYLIDKYKSLVRTRARALYLVGGDHEDLIQEGMLGLFKAVRDYKPDGNASQYEHHSFLRRELPRHKRCTGMPERHGQHQETAR